MPDESTVEYVNGVMNWYDAKSGNNRWIYLAMKVTQIILAAAIPILSLRENVAKEVVAVMGGTIGIIEGILQLGQFHQNWIRYRATCEGLRSELFLFRSGAGPYAQANPQALLAERANSLIAAENSKWQSLRETAAGKDKE